MTKYLLDANVFITADAEHYGLDFCPAFWEWLILQNEAEKIFSIDRVKNEVLRKQDAVSKWARLQGDGFFLRQPDDLWSALTDIGVWLRSQEYDDAAVSAFMGATEYYKDNSDEPDSDELDSEEPDSEESDRYTMLTSIWSLTHSTAGLLWLLMKSRPTPQKKLRFRTFVQECPLKL